MSQFAQAPETVTLIRFLQEAAESGRQEIPYAELNALIGMSVQDNPGYGYLRTARDRLIEDHNHVWKCRKNVGLFLVPAAQRARWGTDVSRHKIRREVRRGTKIMKATDFSKCSEQDILAFNTGGIVMSMIDQITDTRKVKQLETRVEKTPEPGPMSIDDTLKYLGLKRDEGKTDNKPDNEPDNQGPQSN